LSSRASQIFPGIDHQQLQAFAEIFGHSAFVCRYFNCIRATQGFNSSKQRAAHEATHERKFRCTDSSCVSFSTGFAKRNDLNRHNEKYHTSVGSYISLSETINSTTKLPLRAKAQDNVPFSLNRPSSKNTAEEGVSPQFNMRPSPKMALRDLTEEARWRQKNLESQTNSSDKATLEPLDTGN
jgi:hypothetical protein